MKPIGVLPKPGAVVSARREADDDEYEPATVKSSDLSAGTISLRFADGYQAAVPLSQVKLDMPPAGEAPPAAPAAPDEPRVEELDHGYETEVRPTLPTPPTAQALAADPEAKYAYIAASKDAGNALFKQGKYAWAIRTYCDAVDTLAATCYASRERMLWDYQAREPCAQCFSNAALCALKQSEFTRAAELCGYAMECRPEEADLLKVLLRHGQALAGLGQLEAAKEKLERGVQAAAFTSCTSTSTSTSTSTRIRTPTSCPAAEPPPPPSPSAPSVRAARRCSRPTGLCARSCRR